MAQVRRKILEALIDGTTEPTLLVRVDQPDWPVVLVNQAFAALTEAKTRGLPFADVIESLSGRDFALEVSSAVRSGQALSLPLEIGSREYLLVLRPLQLRGEQEAKFFAAYWRGDSASGAAASAEMHHALLKAKRRIHDLSRDDPVTGLLNGRAFGEIFEHDWAVAAREGGRLAVVVLRLDEFDAYLEVFGRHATDSCLRRVGQAIRRCLRRASDVVARPSGASFVVLSHASDESGVCEFAEQIATAVRELGLHHPRATGTRFVTVSHDVRVADVGNADCGASEFLERLLAAGDD